MRQYRLAHKKITPLKGILYVLLAVLAIGTVVFVFGFIAYLLKNQIVTIVSYVGVLVAAVFIVKWKLQDYIYTIDEKNYFLVDKVTGTRMKRIVDFHLRDALWCGKMADMPEEYKKITLQRATFLKKAESAVLVYMENNIRRAAAFSPSQEFLDTVRELVEKYQERKKREERFAESSQNSVDEEQGDA